MFESSVLQQHMLIHIKICDGRDQGQSRSLRMPHECTKCDNAFEFRGQLQLHGLRCHSLAESDGVHVPPKHRGKRIECELCAKIFKAPSALKTHMHSHTGEKPHGSSSSDQVKKYTCNIAKCGKNFRRKYQLYQHNLTVHCKDKDKPHECDICGRCFAEKGNASRHRLTHLQTRPRPYVCEICGRTFIQKYYLVIHMRNHRGEKPFSCEICGKSFADKRQLKKHDKTHL